MVDGIPGPGTEGQSAPLNPQSTEHVKPNRFGKEWSKLDSPIVGTVGAIDDNGTDAGENRIGLSAMQLSNLGLERKQEITDTKSWLTRQVLRNTEGLTSDTEYGMVKVVFEDKQAFAQVYNAFGKLGFEGPKVRISSKLADELKLAEGTQIEISKPKSILDTEENE